MRALVQFCGFPGTNEVTRKLPTLIAIIVACICTWFAAATAPAQQIDTAVRLYGAAAQPAYSQYGTAAFDPTRYTTYYGTTASPFQYVGYGYGMYRPWLYRPSYYPYGYGYGLGYGGYGGYGLGYGGYGLGYGGYGLGYGGYGLGGLGYGGMGFGGYGYGYRPWYGGYGYPYSSYYSPGFASYGLGWGYPYNSGMFGPWGGLGGPLGWGGYGGCYYW